jgi:hypothetical protein
MMQILIGAESGAEMVQFPWLKGCVAPSEVMGSRGGKKFVLSYMGERLSEDSLGGTTYIDVFMNKSG